MKKILAGILASVIAGTAAIPAFAAGDIAVEELTVNEETENLKDSLKDRANEEDGMLRISSSMLVKIKLKLEAEEAESKDVFFISNQVLGENEALTKDKIQFADQKNVEEDGTVTIQFRPRANQPAGVYNMRANAMGATSMFSKFYKTVNNEIQPVLSRAGTTELGNDIELTISNYTDEWKEANELWLVKDGNKTKIENYSFDGETEMRTLKIPTTGTALSSADTYTLSFIPITEGGAYNPITFTATVTEQVYTVTLDADGGTDVTMNTFKRSELGEGIAIPETTKNGYSFDGWYTDKGYTKKVESITAANISEIFGENTALSLFAKWTPQKYTITYYNTEGTQNLNQSEYTIDSEKITLIDLSRIGYTFDGWYSDEQYAVRVTEIPTGSTGNKSLYAKWTDKKFAVSVNVCSSTGKDVVGSTDGIVTGVAEQVQEGVKVETSVTAPEGYEIASVRCGSQNCAVENGKYTFIMPSENVELTVTLNPITYTILLDLNEGSGISDTRITGTVEELPQLPSDKPDRDGFDFTYWSTEQSGGMTVTNESINTAAKLVAFFGESASKTIYAQWTEHGKFKVSYVANGVNVTNVPTDNADYDSEVTTEVRISSQEPVRPGYIFNGWIVAGDSKIYKYDGENSLYTDISSINSVLEFTAQWTAVENTITYELDGGENSAANPDTYTAEDETILLEEPTKNGYTFIGWYRDENFENKVTQIVKGSTEDITVYAKWEEIKVISITVTPDNSNIITEENGTIEFSAETGPENAHDKTIVWSVVSENGQQTDKVSISSEGVFMAGDISSNGKYIVKALNEASGKIGIAEVVVNIQSSVLYSINNVNEQTGIVNITKNSSERAYLVVATYSGQNHLIKALIKDISDRNTVSEDIDVKGVFDVNYASYKVFIWNSLESMQPRCGVWSK